MNARQYFPERLLKEVKQELIGAATGHAKEAAYFSALAKKAPTANLRRTYVRMASKERRLGNVYQYLARELSS